jgi:hypothetical protein
MKPIGKEILAKRNQDVTNQGFYDILYHNYFNMIKEACSRTGLVLFRILLTIFL